MASLVIRDIPEDVLAAVDARAAASGQSREAYLRQQIAALATAALVRVRYRLRGLGEDRPNGDPASVLIRRDPEGLGPGHAANCSQEQINAYRLAKELVAHNAPGDRERAIGLLTKAGFEVFES